MDSDEEYESFEVTEEDLMGGFNVKRRKFTKEDSIYGMWAQHDSDEETRSVNAREGVSESLWVQNCGILIKAHH